MTAILKDISELGDFLCRGIRIEHRIFRPTPNICLKKPNLWIGGSGKRLRSDRSIMSGNHLWKPATFLKAFQISPRLKERVLPIHE
jgi:hypothetical protein